MAVRTATCNEGTLHIDLGQLPQLMHRYIANKTCVLQIAPVCMTENLGTKNLTLFSMLIHYLPVKVIGCSRILSVYPSNTQS